MCRYISNWKSPLRTMLRRESFLTSLRESTLTQNGKPLYVMLLFFCFTTVAPEQSPPQLPNPEDEGFLYEHSQITVDYIINLTIKYKNLVITR